MKIQIKSLKNKTFNTFRKIKLNPKFIKQFSSTSYRESNITNKDKSFSKIDNKKLNYIYMALNKTIKFNNYDNNSINNINSLYNNSIPKRNSNKSSFLQNIFLASILNIENINLNGNDTNKSVKNINMSKYLSEYFNKNSAKSPEDFDNKNNNNSKNNLYKSFNNTKRYKNIFSLMRIKSNIKYIRQSPYFRDLNLQPSSEKSLLYFYEKKNSILASRNIKCIENNKKNIPRINLMKKIKNSSNIFYKLKNLNNFLLEENKNKDLDKTNNSHNYNYNNSFKNLKKNRINKKDKIIFSYNYINNKKIIEYRGKSHTNNKSSKLAKLKHIKFFNEEKNIIKKNNEKNKNIIFRLNSCKKSNQKIIYKNIFENKNDNNKNNNDMNIFNEYLNRSNMSFSDDIKKIIMRT